MSARGDPRTASASRVGRVAALAHRPDVEDLELVLGRARDRLDVLDLVGGRILEVETVPDAQVDAQLVIVRKPAEDLCRLHRCDLGLAEVRAGESAHQHERADDQPDDQPAGRDPREGIRMQVEG